MARRPAAAPRKFEDRLILVRWLLRVLGEPDFPHLADKLKDPVYEGVDENNGSRFRRQMSLILPFERPGVLQDADLARYDGNIMRHWNRIMERRSAKEGALWPKYFQWLALLFTEIYLDRYFTDPDGLLVDLNREVAAFNANAAPADHVPEYKAEELNKLAFWQATGSGKTLLMHVNILQFQHYQRREMAPDNLGAALRRENLNRIILITPNEGLSRQHLTEFHASGIAADLFEKDGASLFAGEVVNIIDIHKLREEAGPGTVAVESFEGNNLVLVDEGHKGSGGDTWMETRNRLSADGFSFEYSATFSQALKAANKPELTADYAKCILVDYSYKYFYKDGYGKDYRIYNLQEQTGLYAWNEEQRALYLTACVLTYYQQLRLYDENRAALQPFRMARPLWVFVGARVNAVSTKSGQKVSDVVDILLFLADFLKNSGTSIARIGRLRSQTANLLDGKGRDILANAFTFLASAGTDEEVFQDLLRRVFNAETPGALRVERLKGPEGEIALRIGESERFGVINVGDDASLFRLCEEQDALSTFETAFTESLFRSINEETSPIRLLIGAKKFSEGWNSWRVSTMGLMNVGRKEGSEIIQLFGRGVRLKGYNFCLKRSSHLTPEQRAPQLLDGMRHLETLNVFGVRADYMQQFKEFLELEGLPANEERKEATLDVTPLTSMPVLKSVRVKENLDFKKDGPRPNLEPHESVGKRPVALNWYPRVQGRVSKGIDNEHGATALNEAKIEARHVAFINWDEVFFALQEYKSEKGWHNLNIPRDAAVKLLAEDHDWYDLRIPAAEMEPGGFARVRVWQELTIALLKLYCDRYYKHKKAEWESDKLEYVDVTPEDANFPEAYRLLLEEDEAAIVKQVGDLATAIGDKKIASLGSIAWDRHLYHPLLWTGKDCRVEVRPVPLNDGERRFVDDLVATYQQSPGLVGNREVYLLRNMSRRGVGFFEAGNFYPDFLLWLVEGDRQYVTFVDPKGIRNSHGLSDPKIAFHADVKNVEAKLGNPTITLNSFIISNTSIKQIDWWEGGITEADLRAHNVLFQDDPTYIKTLLAAIVSSPPTTAAP